MSSTHQGIVPSVLVVNKDESHELEMRSTAPRSVLQSLSSKGRSLSGPFEDRFVLGNHKRPDLCLSRLPAADHPFRGVAETEG